MKKTLAELADLIKGTVVGDPKTLIKGVTNIELPEEGSLTFVSDKRRLKEAEAKPFAALIVPVKLTSEKKPVIQAPNPKLAWAVLLGLFNPTKPYSGILSDQAHISDSAKIGNGVTVEPFAVVGEHVILGNHSVIRAHAHIDDRTEIGQNSIIHPYTMLYRNTKIGSRVIIHAGCVIGCDGFGYVFDGLKQAKVPQVGNVVIEDDVEIGAASTIDRATVGSTTIHQGVKIDNLVQIAHNVDVGAHTCLSAQVGISGSSKIGSYVTMGGRAGLGDHCEVGDAVMLGAQTGLPTGKKIPANQVWIGAPARPYKEMRKQVGAQLRSYETQQLVRELKKRIEALEEEISEFKTAKT
jgi:UDP-3-O-[3-hydroxymyristoyl] glucosamine N-acyltransferase